MAPPLLLPEEWTIYVRLLCGNGVFYVCLFGSVCTGLKMTLRKRIQEMEGKNGGKLSEKDWLAAGRFEQRSLLTACESLDRSLKTEKHLVKQSSKRRLHANLLMTALATIALVIAVAGVYLYPSLERIEEGVGQDESQAMVEFNEKEIIESEIISCPVVQNKSAEIEALKEELRVAEASKKVLEVAQEKQGQAEGLVDVQRYALGVSQFLILALVLYAFWLKRHRDKALCLVKDMGNEMGIQNDSKEVVSVLEVENNDLHIQITQMQTENNKLKEEYAAVESENKELKSKENSLITVRAENERLKQQTSILSTLQMEIETMTAAVQKIPILESKKAELMEKLDAVSTLEQERVALTYLLSNKEATKRELEERAREYSKLQADIDEITAKIELIPELKIQKARLKGEVVGLSGLEKDLRIMEIRLKSRRKLKEELDAKVNEMDSLQREVTVLEDKIKTKVELEAEKNRLLKRMDDMRDLENEIEELYGKCGKKVNGGGVVNKKGENGEGSGGCSTSNGNSNSNGGGGGKKKDVILVVDWDRRAQPPQCKGWLEGHCKYGDACWFKHG